MVGVVSARGPPSPLGGPGPLQQAAGALREGLATSAGRVLDPRPAGLLPGLVVGDTRSMDPVLDEDFQRAGLAHLTAVSGANVAIVLTAVLWPLRRRAVDRRAQAVAAVFLLIGFVVLAGASASVVRAAAMGAVTLLALATGRPRAALPALGAAVCVLLLLDPGLARDAGFALSVAATAAIVLLAPTWSRHLRSRGCWPVSPSRLPSALPRAWPRRHSSPGSPARSASSPFRPTSSPRPRSPRPPCSGWRRRSSGRRPRCSGTSSSCAGWPTRWLVVVAERAAAVPDAATGWPAGAAGPPC